MPSDPKIGSVTLFSALARWVVRAAVLLGSGSVVVLSLAFEFVRAPVWWIEIVRYAPFPLALPPAIALTLLSVRAGRRWGLTALAGTLGLAIILMGLELHAGDAGHGRLRVMTYNIKAGRAGILPGGYARLAWEVALHDPDVLFMQDAAIADGPHQVIEQARAIVAGRNVFTSGQYVIASRLPLRDCRSGNISVPGQPHHYLRCVITIAGVDVDLVTAHLVSPREGLNAARHERLDGVDDWRANFAHRLDQARTLARDLAHNPRPLIVAGDLNAPQTSPVMAALTGVGLRDAFASAGVGYGYTHGHSLRPGFSFLRIDHILVSAGIGVADCFVGTDQASEHRPVIADLLLVRAP